jgi:acyl-CoA synthetase (AMP-forming)/AMP-acid ligase II
MGFLKLEHPPLSPAVIDPRLGLQKSYGDLCNDVEHVAAAIPKQGSKELVMLLANNRYESVIAYLAALRSGHALLLVDATLHHDLLIPMVNAYRPDYLWSASSGLSIHGYRSVARAGMTCLEIERKKEESSIHESLALLLNTSGSTGSPKLVRLSLNNLQANAASIVSYLNLNPPERPITSLPISYSYGLSVVNSHLLAGACIVLTDYGVLRREFWDAVDCYKCTSFAGVPYTYQMLLQTGLLKSRGASLRKLTQAGGALAPSYVRRIHEIALQRGFEFFTMYGQTEATARISFLPFESLPQKAGSIGIAIPGGTLEMDPVSGELIYAGPNVMMGYAESREDLARGDELGGVLRTGDLARRDEDGFFYITGRMKRFLKLFGKRYNLDEVEQIVQTHCGLPAACFGRDDLLIVAIESADGNTAAVNSMLCSTFGLPRAALQVHALNRLPRTERGKIDYSALSTRETVPAESSSGLIADSARRITQA